MLYTLTQVHHIKMLCIFSILSGIPFGLDTYVVTRTVSALLLSSFILVSSYFLLPFLYSFSPTFLLLFRKGILDARSKKGSDMFHPTASFRNTRQLYTVLVGGSGQSGSRIWRKWEYFLLNVQPLPGSNLD